MAKKTSANTTSTKQLDQIIHEKTRLGIMTTLASKPDGILFTELKDLNDLTDGNLNRHLKVLCDAKLVSFKKSDRGRNARTTYQLTKTGLRAFMDYLDQMEQLIKRASSATHSVAADSSKNSQSGRRLATE